MIKYGSVAAGHRSKARTAMEVLKQVGAA